MNITNDLVTEYINGFYLPLDEELSELRKSAKNAKYPSYSGRRKAYWDSFSGF